MSRNERTTGDGGFVLALVVFMLFAISVAGAAGYLLVASEFAMARYSSQGDEALAVARAGIERFVGEHSGAVPDTVSYAIGDGLVVVTSRKMAETDSLTHLYAIQAEATVADPLAPNAPARRIVTAQAVLHRRPIPHLAALTTSANSLLVLGIVSGIDSDTFLQCPGGGASPITGAVARSGILGTALGVPAIELWPGGSSAVRDSIVARWDVLSDPDFPVDYENTLPALGSIPADSFPIVRYTGSSILNTAGRHNQGVLIWVGTLRPWFLFNWEGIVLAENLGDPFLALPFLAPGSVDGLLIAGLNGDNNPSSVEVLANIVYGSCKVYAANESLAYFELLPNTMFEAR